MPQVEYFLVCRSIQTDLSSDEMSFINVLEDITPESFPYVIPKAVAVSLWNFAPGEQKHDYQAQVVVKVPGEPDAPFRMNFSSGVDRCRAVQGILEIPIAGPGKITFEVLLNNEHHASHTINVHPLDAQSPDGQAMPSSGE